MQTQVILSAVIALAAIVVSEAQLVTPGVFFSNVGGAGSYPMVVNQPAGTPPTCDITNSCQQETFAIEAHTLAPFDEEISLNLRGPLDLIRIAIYQQVNGQFQLVSNWEPGTGATNMTFLMNAPNDWSVCQGDVALGYSNQFGNASSAVSVPLDGFLGAGLEITVLSGLPCNGDCGWYRGVGYHGWAADKIFVIETAMPFSGTDSDIPAIWSLNAQIPRTAQYGCNCWPNCGEFDIAEVLHNGDTKAYQTIYSYNGDISSPGYFNRPTNSPSTYAVHYSISDNKIFAVNIPGGCFPYPAVLEQVSVAALHALAVDVNVMSTSPESELINTCPFAAGSSAGSSAGSAPQVPSTAAPTTAAPTTVAPKTVAPTTVSHTTVAPTTNSPTTVSPTTPAPTTRTVTTAAPTTLAAQATVSPTTKAPTTSSPTTQSPTIPSSNLCRSGCAACCNDILLGPTCIQAGYICASGIRLCPTGTGVCGTGCYDVSMYGCTNEALYLL